LQIAPDPRPELPRSPTRLIPGPPMLFAGGDVPPRTPPPSTGLACLYVNDHACIGCVDKRLAGNVATQMWLIARMPVEEAS
jgi:hypothetical protein